MNGEGSRPGQDVPQSSVIINTVYRIAPESGGVARVLADSSRHIASRSGGDCAIFATDDAASPELQISGAQLHNLPQASTAALATAIGERITTDKPLVFHDHGQWMPINRASQIVARRLNRPRIVSPHGMLTDWAFNHRRLKKRLAWTAFGRRLLLSADAIHVTSEMEAMELRRRGVDRAAEIIPLGIDTSYDMFDRQRRRDTCKLLYLSRLHRKKGIYDLLAVWPMVRQPGWELWIAGPDEEEIIATEGLPDHSRYLGVVDGDEKWQSYESADLFVLPTLSENFGLVIGEALYAGTPVITTQVAPWQAIRDHHCGWWIESGRASLATAMRCAMQTDPDELTAMGQRGRRFVRDNLTWEVYAERMVELFHRCANTRHARNENRLGG